LGEEFKEILFLFYTLHESGPLCRGATVVPRHAGADGFMGRVRRESFGGKAHSRSLHSATPDFLSNFVASANFMRLSLLKAALAAVGECRVAGNPGSLRSG
jgi:hypothetical protein